MATAIARRPGRAAAKANEPQRHLVLPLESEGSVHAWSEWTKSRREAARHGTVARRVVVSPRKRRNPCSETVSPGNGGSLRVESIRWREPL
jgi:hypothetical protein